jgi:hypothetical protein
MSKYQCPSVVVAELNRLENCLFLANVTMPRVCSRHPNLFQPEACHEGQ